MAIFSFFRPCFPSRDEEFLEFFTPLGPFNNLIDSLNPGPSLAIFSAINYTNDDLQQIFRMVSEVQVLIACDQDSRIFNDSLERVFKLRAINIYKAKLHIDCYNFIQ